jgi:hypothetical protein|tara:strand:- start:4784 stop:5596 length:813 start_codon:yes stop_codon:yes gene_type:complete
MNYDEYYSICKRSYTGEVNHNSVGEFYSKPVKIYQSDFFGTEYNDLVNTLSAKIKEDFDNNKDCESDNIMVKHTNIWKFHKEISNLSKILVPFLEENRYGCHLYVDKIYIYRTLKLENRVSSYEWHYDNNPNEIVKTLIYLNDVDESNSPYEFLKSPKNEGILGQCTRKGTECWYPAPNNSRVGHLIEGLKKQGCAPQKITGNKGTAVSFVNNSIHRANPILKGYRDAINIRVKPTLQKAPEYANSLYTTSYEHSGVVNQNPAHAWKSLI